MAKTFDDHIHTIEQVGREHDVPLNLRSADDPEPSIVDLRDAYEVRERVRAKIASREPDTHQGIARLLRRILGTEEASP